MKKSKCLIGIIIFVIAVSVVYRAYVVPNVLYPVRYDEYVESAYKALHPTGGIS